MYLIHALKFTFSYQYFTSGPDSFYKSKCLYIRLFVCLSVRHTFLLRLPVLKFVHTKKQFSDKQLNRTCWCKNTTGKQMVYALLQQGSPIKL